MSGPASSGDVIDERRDRRALRAVAVQFFVNGAVFASFLPRLPEIRDRVDLDVGGIGLLMSLAGVAGLAASAGVGPAISRYGTRRVMIGAGVLLASALPFVGLARTPVVLLCGLAAMSGLDVLVDVSMNMQGSWLSARRHAPVMNRLHGLWSLGTVVGGISSARVAAAGVSLDTHLVMAGGLLLAVLGYVGPGLLRADERLRDASTEEAGEDAGPRLGTALFLFGAAGFFAVALESGAIEWAAFRLRDDFGTSVGFAALGYVAVTGGMTVGRFGGDWMAVRLGDRRLSGIGIGLCGLGLVGAALMPDRGVALAGFAVAGLGIATLLPMLYDAAARHPGRPGAGLGALTAGLRVATLSVPLVVGSLGATALSVGEALALVTLPAVMGFLVVTVVLGRRQAF